MANEGMGMAGGFAEAAGGVMSGFQYARQQQALEQQRKQQELQDAENRADSKMKRELLMKEIQNKEKAREIYAMDPVKDFGLDAKGFANRDLYEAELSKRYAAEFRKAGLGEESVKHESVGGQFYEQGMKKASKKAFGMALSGDTDGAKKVLDSIGFNIDKIQEFKQKDGSKGFHIIDKIGEGENAPEKIVSTIGVAELAGVMGDEDLMMEFLVKKDSEITSNYNKLEAQINEEKRLEARDIRKEQRANLSAGQGLDPVNKARVEAAHPFVTDTGSTIEGQDHQIVIDFLRGGHSLESVNEMRRGAGLSQIRISPTLKTEERAALQTDLKGLSDQALPRDEKMIQSGIESFNVAKPSFKGREIPQAPASGKPVGTGMGGEKTTTPPKTEVPATPMNQPTDKPKNEPSIYDEKGLTKEERVRFDDLYNRTRRIGEFTGPDAMKQSQKAKDEFNELENIGQSRKKSRENKKGTPPKAGSRAEF